MSEEKNQPHQAFNFKKLYNKRYGDIVTMNTQHRYTPEQVFDMAVKYFEWAESNAIKSAETSSFQGRTYQDEVKKPRVFTWAGLKLFCGWSEGAITKWRKEPGYCDVMAFVDTVIHEQKYQLAANGIINAGMVAKELGIDKPAQVNVEAVANAEQTIQSVTADEVKEAVIDILEKI